jgi:hypothetical protein
VPDPEAAVDAGVRFATLEQMLATLVTAPRSGRPRLVRPARVRRVSEWRGLRAP